MKKLVLFGILCITFIIASAQSRSRWSYGVTLNPSMVFTFNNTSSSDIVPGTIQSYKNYTDSINNNKSYRMSIWNVTGWVSFSPDLDWTYQLGLGYMDVGFQLNQNNVQLNDKLYPGIGVGRLIELSNSVKNVNYDYRYQYLHVPLIVNYHLFRSGDYFTNIYLSAGVSFDFLLKHNLTANLDNFYVDDQKTFNIDSTGYTGRGFAMSLMFGARGEYKLDKNTSVMIQPMIGFFPFSVSSSPISVYPLYLSLSAGIIYEIDN